MTEQNVLTVRSSQVYDSHFGFYVKKLAQDTSIPILQKISGPTWSPVYTASDQEERLVHLLTEKQITAYYPAILDKDKTAKKILFFPGVVSVGAKRATVKTLGLRMDIAKDKFLAIRVSSRFWLLQEPPRDQVFTLNIFATMLICRTAPGKTYYG